MNAFYRCCSILAHKTNHIRKKMVHGIQSINQRSFGRIPVTVACMLCCVSVCLRVCVPVCCRANSRLPSSPRCMRMQSAPRHLGGSRGLSSAGQAPCQSCRRAWGGWWCDREANQAGGGGKRSVAAQQYTDQHQTQHKMNEPAGTTTRAFDQRDRLWCLASPPPRPAQYRGEQSA